MLYKQVIKRVSLLLLLILCILTLIACSANKMQADVSLENEKDSLSVICDNNTAASVSREDNVKNDTSQTINNVDKVNNSKNTENDECQADNATVSTNTQANSVPDGINDEASQTNDNDGNDVKDSGATSTTGPNSTIEHAQKINPADYCTYISYGDMSDDAKILVDLVFSAIKNDNGTSSFIEMDLPKRFSGGVPKKIYDEAASFFTFYYGRFDLFHNFFDIYKVCGDSGAKFQIAARMTTLRSCESDRENLTALIEDVLCEMRTGSTVEVLNQVAMWMSKQYSYQDGTVSVFSFWDHKTANCNVVAMVFRMFAERLGIPCDVITGCATVNGAYHAWNRVQLKDGTYRYYDVTLYKSLGDYSYINSVQELNKPMHINNYFF